MKTCSKPNCTNEHYATGLCHKHYMQDYRRKQKLQAAKQGTFNEGYESGLYEGRSQVANAISNALGEHGLSCYISDNTLYLSIPGNNHEINLDDDLF